MLDKLLTNIREAVDYRTAMTAFQVGTPLTPEDVEKLLTLYEKYMPGRDAADPDYRRICLAVDLLPGRDAANPDFALLSLSGKTLEALFLARDILCWQIEVSAENIPGLLQTVQDETVEFPIRILLARAVLDVAAVAKDCGAMRQEIAALADFLIHCDQGDLDRYVILVREVRGRCK